AGGVAGRAPGPFDLWMILDYDGVRRALTTPFSVPTCPTSPARAIRGSGSCSSTRRGTPGCARGSSWRPTGPWEPRQALFVHGPSRLPDPAHARPASRGPSLMEKAEAPHTSQITHSSRSDISDWRCGYIAVWVKRPELRRRPDT